jgi:excisionase family DNA binding protein
MEHVLPNDAKTARRPLTREDVLDIREVAELLHVPRSTIFEYARRGVIPGRKLGRRWVFLRDELDAAVRALPRAEGAPPASQPPVSRPSPRARRPPKRYPEAVPYAARSQQPLSVD